MTEHLSVGQTVKLTNGEEAEVRSIRPQERSMTFKDGEMRMVDTYRVMVRRPGKTRNESVGPFIGWHPDNGSQSKVEDA